MITRTYDKGCEWCGATGKIPARYPMATTVLEDPCPVCNGTGVVNVTEQVDSPQNYRFVINGKDLIGVLKREESR